MRVTFAPPYRLRVLLLLLFALALCVPVAFAQSTVIEPCPATPAPSPAKKEKKGPNSSAENVPKIISRASERLIDASIPDDALALDNRRSFAAGRAGTLHVLLRSSQLETWQAGGPGNYERRRSQKERTRAR